LLKLPDKARLGAAFADMSVFAGEKAPGLAESLGKEDYECIWFFEGFVNARFTDEALRELCFSAKPTVLTLPLESMTEDELFSPMIYAYETLLARYEKGDDGRPLTAEGERRRLLLRLAAANRYGFSEKEELSLLDRVLKETAGSFIRDGYDPVCNAVLSSALVMLEKRLNGGIK